MSIFERVDNVNRVDENGDPAGGEFFVKTQYETETDGYVVLRGVWQDGPIAENGENGIGVENLLLLVKDRLEFYQEGRFACEENAAALASIEEAIRYLRSRTQRRVSAGVEGRNIQLESEGQLDADGA